MLDRALVIRFPGPSTATGEDIVELHLHGGRATVAAVYDALNSQTGVRLAAPGEFTRRAFEHGRLDIFEAEALGDLLRAETEGQRRAAVAHLGGGLRAVAEEIRQAVLSASARLEAAIDFAEEDDVIPWPERSEVLSALAGKIDRHLQSPPAERLFDGVKVVIAGPPNAGKSTLLNALVGRQAAITSPNAGTTRDPIEVPVRLGGQGVLFIDTAGMRANPADMVEVIGVKRTSEWLAKADVVIWLGDPSLPPAHNCVIAVQAKSDICPVQSGSFAVSAVTGQNIAELMTLISREVGRLLPGEDQIALNQRQRGSLSAAKADIDAAGKDEDLLIAAELLKHARAALDRLTGRVGVEDMLDALFSQFCIGK